MREGVSSATTTALVAILHSNKSHRVIQRSVVRILLLEGVAYAEMHIVHRSLVLDDTLEGSLQLVAEANAEVAHIDTYHGVDEHTVHLVLGVEDATYASRHEGRYALVEERVLDIGKQGNEVVRSILEVEEGLGSEAYATTYIESVAEAVAVAGGDAVLLRDRGAQCNVGTVATLVVHKIFGLILGLHTHYCCHEGECCYKLFHS